MTYPDDLSLTALVVALIALVVALAQLSQQIFGTADGYRRCGNSVIGPWSRHRYRKWIWSEFRFQVNFCTPHLMVLPVNPADLDSFKGKDDDPNLYFMLLHSYLPKLGRRGKVVRTLQQSLLGVKAPPRDADQEKHSPHPEVQAAQAVGARSEILASWVLLLRALYSRNVVYWREDLSPAHTDIAVRVREWTWDFMPADIQRPLATSTMSHIILLASRLDMQWRKIGLNGSDYQAGGNGYSLSSFQIRGLPGIVFQFNGQPSPPHQSQPVPRVRIPSTAVDKLYFGIVPGDPTLVRRDFSVIDNEREQDWTPMANALGLRDNSECLTGHSESQNCTAILLCSFLPLPDSSLTSHFAPFWVGDCVFHYWEGRTGFLQAIHDRVDQIQGEGAALAVRHVYTELQNLQQVYHEDFYDLWDDSIIEMGTPARKSQMIQHLRGVFDFTTEFFRGSSGFSAFDWSGLARGSERTYYLELVAAHAVLAYNSLDAGWQAGEDFSARIRDTRDISGGKRELGNAEAYGIAPSYHFVAKEFVNRIRDPDYGIVRHLRGRRVDLSDDDIEAAWWMLVLRGIVWDMSTVGEPEHGGRGVRQMEEAIPSSLYYSETPVWID